MNLAIQPPATPCSYDRPRRHLSTPALDDVPAILPLHLADQRDALHEAAVPDVEAARPSKAMATPVAIPADPLLNPLLPPPETLPALIFLRKASPLRPPDWRWLRAAHLRLEGQEPSRHVDDGYQVTLTKFQNRLAACKDTDDLLRLRLSMPSLYEAWQVHHQGCPAMVAELKARLLAREPLKAIARKMAMKPKAVRWFERSFFNVTDRLDAPGYITHLVVRLHEKDVGDPVYKIWLHMAYWLGPLIVDELVHDASPANRPASPKNVPSALLDDAMATLRRRAVVAVRLMSPDNPKEAAQLIKTFVKLSALEQENRKRQHQHVDITANINIAYNKLVQRIDLMDGVQAEGKLPVVQTEHLGHVQSPWLLP